MKMSHNLGSRKIITAIFVLLIGSIGGAILYKSNAATPIAPSIYLTTPTTTIATNKQFTFDIRENSGTAGVLSADIYINFPSNSISCTSVSLDGSLFSTLTSPVLSGGNISLAVFVNNASTNNGQNKPIYGDQFIGRVTCTSLSNSGTSSIGFSENTGMFDVVSDKVVNLIDSPNKLIGLSMIVDGVGPTITNQGITNNQVLSSNSTVPVTVNSSDTSELSSLEIKIDGVSKQIINTTSKSYIYQWNTSGLSLGNHTFQVIAKDALGNIGQSSITTVTIADKTAPSVTLSPVTVQAGMIPLSATATDSGGGNVVKVEFYAGSTKLGEDTTNPYAFTWNTKNGSFPDGTYSLTAKAYDSATPSNVGTSNTVSATVKNTDDVKPSAPTNLRLTTVSLNSLTLSWNASTDNIGVVGYRISRSGMPTATVTNTSFSESNLTPSTSYSYSVVAVDAAGNESAPAASITATTLAQKVGDFDGDNIVGPKDLTDFGLYWKTTNTKYDINKNGTVDIYDLTLLVYYYGK